MAECRVFAYLMVIPKLWPVARHIGAPEPETAHHQSEAGLLKGGLKLMLLPNTRSVSLANGFFLSFCLQATESAVIG